MCSWGDFMPLFVNRQRRGVLRREMRTTRNKDPPENTNQPFNLNNQPNKGDCIYSKAKECTDT